MQSQGDRRPFVFLVVDDTPLLEALAEYSSAGMRVTFAHAPLLGETGVSCTCGRDDCASPGKHPVGKGWQKSATGDFDALRDGLSRIKFQPSLGIVLGEQPCGEYLIAVDVDDATREGELVEQLGAMPPSLTCHSARGRRVFFRLDAGQDKARIKNVTGLGGAPGVDVKAQNGFVLVAPSVHPTGVRYRWELAPVAPLPPEWFLAIAQPPKPPIELRSYVPATLAADKAAFRRANRWLEAAVTRECAELSRCQKGQRNTVLFTTACSLLRAAVGSHVAGGRGYVLRELEKAALSSGLAAGEVRKTLESADATVERSGEERGPSERENSPSSPPPASNESNGARPKLELVAENGQRLDGLPPAPDDDGIALILDESRRPAPVAENVARLLAQHPAWRGGPAWDDFLQRAQWPAAISETTYVTIQGWLLERPFAERVKAPKEAIVDAVRTAALRHRVDSLRQYVDALPAWDGTSRVGTWLSTYCGALDTPLHRRTGLMWLVSLMARAHEPGCGIEGMLIFEDPRGGAGKNEFVDALFGTRGRTPGKMNFDDRDAKMIVDTTWCVHDDELSSFKRNDLGALQSWITRKTDSYVPKWGTEAVDFPRRCVFLGSTNHTEYMARNDRRFWPARVSAIDVEAVRRDREQLLAEARKLYLDGVKWYVTRDEVDVQQALSEANDSRQETDPFEDQVANVLAPYSGQHVSIGAAWVASRLGVQAERQDPKLAARIGHALIRLGFQTRIIATYHGVRVWVRRRPGWEFLRDVPLVLVPQVAR